METKDVAIVVMASWGDVIISTLIARAIRDQKPGWHITYYTSSACSGAIDNNPAIHNIITIPGNKDQAWGMQDNVIANAKKKHEKVITPWAGWYPQHEWLPLQTDDWHTLPHHNFMWAYVRTAQLEGLKIPNTFQIYLHLNNNEIKKATNFISSLGKTRKVLIEVEGHSGQSWMRQSWISPIQDILTTKYGNDVELLISKGGQETIEISQAKKKWPGRVHLLNNYTLREVAAIFNACDIFIGCSSGTSNACHAHFCKTDIQWFEAVKSTIWDSRPLRPHNKNIYYGEEPAGFFTMLNNNLK